MNENLIIFSIFMIFTGAAVLSTVALYTRQALLIAYLLLGVLLGPWGFKLVADVQNVTKVGDVGIIFLLFLLGLNLNPRDLLRMFKETVFITFISSAIFLILGFLVSFLFGFNWLDSLVVGIAVMFSSTIISLKLLPKSIMKHEPKGEIIISILLLQDLLAVFALLFLDFAQANNLHLVRIGIFFLAVPIVIGLAFFFTHYVLMKLFARFYHMQEYVLLVAIGWCLCFAVIAHILGLSYEIGAFIAGITIATGPISYRIYESLRPLRDFFLVVFFFSVGESFNVQIFSQILIPVLILTAVIVILKPLTFKTLLQIRGESKEMGWEVGFRLGQASCFSLLIANLAVHDQLIDVSAGQLIQVVTTLTFVISSYIVVSKYQTPIANSQELRAQ